jgi:hypothetical protein
MSRYAIWNKKDKIYTPVGEELTPEIWIARYAWINIPNVVPVVAGGAINGAYIGILSDMKMMCEKQGAVFTEGISDEELLAEIEAWEDFMNAPSNEISTDERIAAALEAQVMMSMPDEEV